MRILRAGKEQRILQAQSDWRRESKQILSNSAGRSLCYAKLDGCAADGGCLDKRYVGVEPLRYRNAGVIGAIVARFVSNLSYFDAIEISFDNEPVLAAGVKMLQTIRHSQELPLTPQLGKMYEKSRTSLAERTKKLSELNTSVC